MAAFPAAGALQAQNVCRHLIFCHDPLQFVPVGRGPAVLLEQGAPDELSPTSCSISAKLFTAEKNPFAFENSIAISQTEIHSLHSLTLLKTGTRSKMNINPASSAASE